MENLRKIRKARGLKQKELAKLVGVSESSISQYESGAKTPSFETALKLAEALDCESADLVSTRDIPIIEDKKITATSGDGNFLDLSQLNEEQRLAIKELLRMNPQTLAVALPAIELFLSSQQDQDDKE